MSAEKPLSDAFLQDIIDAAERGPIGGDLLRALLAVHARLKARNHKLVEAAKNELLILDIQLPTIGLTSDEWTRRGELRAATLEEND